MKKLNTILVLLLNISTVNAQCYIANSTGIRDISNTPTNIFFEKTFYSKLYPEFLQRNNNFIEDYNPTSAEMQTLSQK